MKTIKHLLEETTEDAKVCPECLVEIYKYPDTGMSEFFRCLECGSNRFKDEDWEPIKAKKKTTIEIIITK